MATLTFTTTFNLNLTPKQIQFVDTTDYAGQGITDLSFVNGNIEATAPSGIVFHPNSGNYTSSSADIDIEDAVQNHVIQLPVNGSGVVEPGDYTFTYTVYNSDADVYYTKTSVYTFSYITPEIVISQTIDCVSPLFTSKDVTDYVVGATTPDITRTHSLYYPNGSSGQGSPIVTSNDIITTNTFYQGVQTTEISSILLYTFPDGLMVLETITGNKNATVNCVDICGLRCCINDLEQLMESQKCSNSELYAETSALFSTMMAVIASIKIDVECGYGDLVSCKIAFIKKITHCKDGCNDCGAQGSQVLGIGTILNNVVVQRGGSPIIVETVVAGTLTTYTITLDPAFVTFVNGLFSTVVANGLGTGSVDDSGIISGIRTYTINMPSTTNTHQYSQTFRTLAGGAVLVNSNAQIAAIFGATTRADLVSGTQVLAFVSGAWSNVTTTPGVVIAVVSGGINVTLGYTAYGSLTPVKVVVSGKSTILTDTNYDEEGAITAFAGGGASNAIQLVSEKNNITICATALDSVRTKQAILGKSITIKNSGAEVANVYPFQGQHFRGLGANVPVTLASNDVLEAVCFVASEWEILRVYPQLVISIADVSNTFNFDFSANQVVTGLNKTITSTGTYVFIFEADALNPGGNKTTSAIYRIVKDPGGANTALCLDRELFQYEVFVGKGKLYAQAQAILQKGDVVGVTIDSSSSDTGTGLVGRSLLTFKDSN